MLIVNYPVSFVEQEVHDGEVWHEAEAVLENLGVGFVGERVAGLATAFRVDDVAQVVNIFPLRVIGNKLFSLLRLEILAEKFQYDLCQFQVEIEEKIKFLFVKRSDIILEIKEIRTTAVSRVNALPVQPLLRCGKVDAHIQNGHFGGNVYYGDG